MALCRWFLVLIIPLVGGCGDGGEDPDPAAEHLQAAGDASHPEDPEAALREEVRLRDAEGRNIVLARSPRRIISLVPSATQTLVQLGAEGLVVARTDFDTDPALEELPSVGPGLQPSIELLLGLAPDLVIRFAGDSDRVTSGRLEELEIPQFAVRPDRIADIRQIIRDLGSLTGHRREADSILSAMDRTLRDLERRLADRTQPRVAYLLGGNPPWVAGAGTFVDELVRAAGGSNVFGDLDVLYGPVSPEELLVRDIDLLLVPEGSGVVLEQGPIPIRRVSPALEIPGPDVADAAWDLAHILHPEAFR